MISGIDLKATVDFKLKDDKNNPTVWKLGVIPSLIFLRIMKDAQEKAFETAFKIVQLSLKGWENFDIPYKTVKENVCNREMEVVPMDILERIPYEYIMELSNKSMEINQLSEKERKN